MRACDQTEQVGTGKCELCARDLVLLMDYMQHAWVLIYNSRCMQGTHNSDIFHYILCHFNATCLYSCRSVRCGYQNHEEKLFFFKEFHRLKVKCVEDLRWLIILKYTARDYRRKYNNSLQAWSDEDCKVFCLFYVTCIYIYI